MATLVEATFPGLTQGNYSVTGPSSKRYNCIAWAAGDSSNWWWPGPNLELEFWPATVNRAETLEALFADEKNDPKHAARQLPNGRWTSKLGILDNIEHELHALEGTAYGAVVLVMKRPT